MSFLVKSQEPEPETSAFVSKRPSTWFPEESKKRLGSVANKSRNIVSSAPKLFSKDVTIAVATDSFEIIPYASSRLKMKFAVVILEFPYSFQRTNARPISFIDMRPSSRILESVFVLKTDVLK